MRLHSIIERPRMVQPELKAGQGERHSIQKERNNPSLLRKGCMRQSLFPQRRLAICSKAHNATF